MFDKLEPGEVALVGAGPGDPGLITVRGRSLLEQADAVVYDALANPKLLDHAPAADKIYVGKLAARHSMTQDQINKLLIDLARKSRRVVRLKGGDPFVFGRGGEEAAALAEVGIRFTVVPGITAAIAGAAYAGIPVTHRDLNSSFTLLTGHEKEQLYQDPEARERSAVDGGKSNLSQSPSSAAGGSGASTDLDWSALARLPCVAFYMGVKALPRIAQKLIEAGMPVDTPAATISHATTPEQQTVVATIGTIADAVVREKVTAPAITIVGTVVSMRDSLQWFENRPLFGKTVIVTRSRQQSSDLSACLTTLGARVIEAPTVEIMPVDDLSTVDRSITRMIQDTNKCCIIFTSVNGVELFRQRLRTLKFDGRSRHGFEVAVIGHATADAVRALLCIEPDYVSSVSTAEGLSDELIAKAKPAGRRFVIFRAEIARPVLVERLIAAGASVEDVAVYQTKLPEQLPPDALAALADGKVDWVTFTSGTTATNFALLLGSTAVETLLKVKIASIGPVTSAALATIGLAPTVVAESASIDALVAAMVAHTPPKRG